MPRPGALLNIGRMKGAPHVDLHYSAPRTTSVLNHFTIRYYPRTRIVTPNTTQSPKSVPGHTVLRLTDDPGSSQRDRSEHDQVHTVSSVDRDIKPSIHENKTDNEHIIRLSEYLTFSYTVPIAKTSKKAVVRRRLVRRISESFRRELQRLGPMTLPPRPMHVVVTPRLSVFTAPVTELDRDVAETWEMVRHKRPTSRFRETVRTEEPLLLGEKRPPTFLRTKEAVSASIRSCINKLPSSPYLDSHGGAQDLLRRLQEYSSSPKRGDR